MKQKRPVLFLDFDDVICLNAPYGGYEAKLALKEGSFHSSLKLIDKLFDCQSKKYLKEINEKFQPFYVLSTSWWWLYEHAELVEILECCGLQFVSENLHPTWATPKQERRGLRAAEVKSWLYLHPEFSDSWVVLDDKLSGSGFHLWPRKDLSYVVLCQEYVGLGEPEFMLLQAALERRMDRPL